MNYGEDMAEAIRVVILDDHALFHQALEAWLTANAPEVTIAYSGSAVIPALNGARDADVVLLDLDLGADVPPLPELVKDFRSTGAQILIVSALGSPSIVRAGLRAGALGYMSKREPPVELLGAIRAVAAGDGFLTPEMASILAEAPDEVPHLSVQELTALRLYASGMKLESVARRMNVSPATAKEYLDRVRNKYAAANRHVRTKAELAQAAEADGFMPQVKPTVFPIRPGRRRPG